jgi:hypothetical protein
MDHVVYVDAQADELRRLLDGSKTMIVRGAAGRKLPYGRVSAGDRLYFINDYGNLVVTIDGVRNDARANPTVDI